MKKKTLALAALAATAAMGSAHAQISGDVIKIGMLTDLSGVYADIDGPGGVEAVKMAIADMKGMAAGKKIEFIYADHQNKADVASAKAREWFDTQGVDMLIGGTNSGTALAMATVAAEKHKPFIVIGAGSARLTNEACTPYTIHYAYDTVALARGTVVPMVKGGGKNWYFLTADYAFGASLQADATEVITKAGGKVLGSVKHPLNASDFSSFLLQAQASKAKVVGLANAGGDTINSIKAANEFGLTKNQTLVGLLTTIADVHSLGLPTTQGMMFTEAFYWNLNAETREWSRRYFGKTKKMPTMIQAGTYSAVTTYLDAVKASGTDDTATVMKQLKSMTVNDFFAKNGKIREDGRFLHDYYLVQVKKPGESKEPWDYYNVKATIPANEAAQPMSASRCPLVKKS
jgi:branched-chain amino acid transport system substrate-binding protein